MTDPIRIANCSGFFGDRLSAAAEMVEGGSIDVLTGDWLAELTMLILARQRVKHGTGYARTFLTQMEQVLGTCVDRGIKIISNAGGLDPAGLAEALSELADRLGVSVRIGIVTGDDLMPDMESLLEKGESFTNLDTGEAISDLGISPITANAYLGGEPITEALSRGADIVVTGRVTDAALVIGPAAWHHGWGYLKARGGERQTLNSFAGALVAGHIIECGAQATGGNYAFFTEVPDLEHPGFPIAEVAFDGSSVITKHEGTGGMVTIGTVTAQLLYEIAGPLYANPDVTARFDTIKLSQVGPDRVLVNGTVGEVAPERLKVAMNYLGGFRNSLTLVITGAMIEEKADLALRTIAGVTFEQARRLVADPMALARESSLGVREFSVEFQSSGHDDPLSAGDAQSRLRLTVKDSDPSLVGKGFTQRVIEAGLSSYPGFFPTSPPGEATPFGVYWPSTVARENVAVQVTL